MAIKEIVEAMKSDMLANQIMGEKDALFFESTFYAAINIFIDELSALEEDDDEALERFMNESISEVKNHQEKMMALAEAEMLKAGGAKFN